MTGGTVSPFPAVAAAIAICGGELDLGGCCSMAAGLAARPGAPQGASFRGRRRVLDILAIFGDAVAVVYPGGKNGCGVFQRLINLMPPHSTYIEPFVGGGAVLRLKRPAALNIGVDLDGDVIARWKSGEYSIDGNGAAAAAIARPGDVGRNARGDRSSLKMASGSAIAGKGAASSPARFLFKRADALRFLTAFDFTGAELVYCDPPYIRSTRRDAAAIYRCEMTDAQHEALLDVLLDLPCRVMVSGYWSKLYARRLRNWEAVTYNARTRGGHTAKEWVWFNYARPVALHDYRFLGANYREREKLKRQKKRWVARLLRMPTLERQALLSAVASVPGWGSLSEPVS